MKTIGYGLRGADEACVGYRKVYMVDLVLL